MQCFAHVSRSGAIDKQFAYWRGRSGRAFVHSVYAPEAMPRYADAVYLVVRRTGGERELLEAGATGSVPDLYLFSRRVSAALMRGGNEVHVHVPATDGLRPEAVARDILDTWCPRAEPAAMPERMAVPA